MTSHPTSSSHPTAAAQPAAVLLPLGFAVALSLLGDLSLFATLTTQLDALGLTLAQAGVLLSIHRLVRIPGNPIAGALMDRLGRRPLFLLGMLLAVLSTASYGISGGFWLFLAGRVLWGLAWVLLNVGGLNMVLDLSNPATRGRLTGLYNAWVWAGYALAPLLGGFLVDAIAFRPAMQVLAVCTCLGLFAAVWRLPETCPPDRRTLAGATTGRLTQLWNDARDLLVQQPAIRRGLILFAMVQFAGDGIVLSSLSLLVTQRLGSSVAVGPLAFGVASFSGGLLAARSVLAGATGPAAGHLSDGRFSRPQMIAVGLVLGTLSFSLLGLAPSLVWILLGVLAGAAAGGILSTALPAYIGDMAPPGQQGATLGAYATFGDAGSMAGPLLTLALAPLIGLAPVYLFAAAIFLLGAFWITRK